MTRALRDSLALRSEEANRRGLAIVEEMRAERRRRFGIRRGSRSKPAGLSGEAREHLAAALREFDAGEDVLLTFHPDACEWCAEIVGMLREAAG